MHYIHTSLEQLWAAVSQQSLQLIPGIGPFPLLHCTCDPFITFTHIPTYLAHPYLLVIINSSIIQIRMAQNSKSYAVYNWTSTSPRVGGLGSSLHLAQKTETHYRTRP